MKKLTSLLLALLMLLGMMAVPTMAAADDVSVYLFGEKLEFDVPAQIVNGRTLVPVRKIFESLGYTVDWNNDTRTAIATSTERTIRITIDSYTMYVNNEAKALDVPACIIDGRTLVPARAISEASGYKVDWNGDTRSVLITKAETAPEDISTNKFDELSKVIMAKGTLTTEENGYYLESDDGVTVTYYLGGNGYQEEVIIRYIVDNSDGSKVAAGISLTENSTPKGLFEYAFTNGRVSSMYGEFPAETGRFKLIETNFDSEIRADALRMFDSMVRSDLSKGFKNLTGFKLSDFGVA